MERLDERSEALDVALEEWKRRRCPRSLSTPMSSDIFLLLDSRGLEGT